MITLTIKRKNDIVGFAGHCSFKVNPQKKFGGLALYTVRNDMATNAKASLLAVAEAGY